MKILYLNNSLTHYDNRVLSRLASMPNVDLLVVAPTKRSHTVGPGVYETREGISFRLVLLEERVRFKYFTYYDGLPELLKKERPDVIIALDHLIFALVTFPQLVWVRWWLRATLIMRTIPYGLPTWNEEMQRLGREGGRWSARVAVRKLFGLALKRWSFRSVDAHLNYSPTGKKVFPTYGVDEKRIFVAGNSPDTGHFFDVYEKISREQPAIVRDTNQIIHIGRLIPGKRVDLLLQAVEILSRENPKVRLIVVGDGPERAALEQQAAALGIAARVEFKGAIYDTQVLARLCAASGVYVLAGVGGLSLNDAMCFALPVICAECDGTEAALIKSGENGDFFRKASVDDLVNKVRPILGDAKRIAEMGARSQAIIKHGVNVDSVLAVYLQAAEFTFKSPGRLSRGPVKSSSTVPGSGQASAAR